MGITGTCEITSDKRIYVQEISVSIIIVLFLPVRYRRTRFRVTNRMLGNRLWARGRRTPTPAARCIRLTVWIPFPITCSLRTTIESRATR